MAIWKLRVKVERNVKFVVEHLPVAAVRIELTRD